MGFLGRGIATCLLEHGFQVIALEPDRRAWQAIAGCEALIEADAAKDLARCELIIETITEDFGAKQALYDQLEQELNPAVPIASNTSGFSITVLQSRRKHPERFAGMHWAAPAELTLFMEIVKGDHTDDATVQQIEALARELGKEPAIVKKDVPGFIANRLAYAMYREALHLFEEGVADVETIDLVSRNSFGLWAPLCGPFRWMDITGGPALYAKAMESIVPTLCNQVEVPQTMQRLREENKRGTQNGEGFYRYVPEDDAEWQKKLHEQAERLWALDQEHKHRH